MKIQIVLAAFLGVAVEMITALRGNDWRRGGIQSVNMDNRASSNANSLAINAECFGNANSLAVGSATNFNCVDQDMKNKQGCHYDDDCNYDPCDD